MKKFIVFLCFIIISNCSLCPEAKTTAQPKLLNTNYAALMDLESGRLLFEKDCRKIVPMASTTKIMTAIVALENSSFNEIVTVSKRASSVSGSTVGLKNGEKVTMEELIYGLMLQSGNDCAIAIAEHIGGSVEKFAFMMDSKAFDIGAFDTHFVTPHGLDREGHFTTAFDLALITRYAMQNDVFRRIVSTKNITINGYNHKRAFYNTNRMLWSLDGANGVKTGYTGRAGRCLVSSVSSGGRDFICVTLNSPNRWEDSKKVLKYGMDNYKNLVKLNQEDWMRYAKIPNGVKNKLKVGIAGSMSIPVSDEEISLISIVPEFNENLEAPIKDGQQVGDLIVYAGDKKIYSLPMVSLENISKAKIKKDNGLKIFKK